jgi:predicted nucleic acid-binding protein
LSIFVDTSVWFAATVARDRDNQAAKSILASTRGHVTTDHVLVETWLLLNSRYRRDAAERFWNQMRGGPVTIEGVTKSDLEAAWAIGLAFPDQDFSIVDRTSFTVMERLGIVEVASFDHHFSVYRYGRARERAFDVVRSGPSEAFRLFHQAILERKQIICRYGDQQREVCPHILGHKDGDEKALVFQFGGKTASRLPPGGEWRCFNLNNVRDIALRDGPWHSGNRHLSRQKCVDKVYIDVNTDVPNQPGRR